MGDIHSGDEGYTGILGEGRLPKHHVRLEALGAIDEATAAFGLARATAGTPEVPAVIVEIQRDLYRIMSEVAATPSSADRFRAIDVDKVSWVEEQIEIFNAFVKMPEEFILPGDTVASAALDLARTAVRRAERRIVEIFHKGEIENSELIRYINRLSTLCFTMELYEVQLGGRNTLTLARGGTGT